eukprot:TRINITY_DN1228_c0_g1_i1.p1 TRINITY_DN1228_c0_g1~~TRINITY_DN1228_c0_g1_i1.p1  ORF type:complete len:126 (-),score=33.63 TRINITY_DN1228_c0_g1_i1:296-673(-)
MCIRDRYQRRVREPTHDTMNAALLMRSFTRTAPAMKQMQMAFMCSDSRLTGTVKWYNPIKGYGFITQDKDGSDLFCHQSTIEVDGFRQLFQGDQVEYETQETDRGPQTAAVYIKVSNAPVPQDAE